MSRRRILALCTGLAVCMMLVAEASASSRGKEFDRTPSAKQLAEAASRTPSVSFPSLQQIEVGVIPTPLAPDAVLYDQTSGPGAAGAFTSQNFEAANDAFDNQGADDFVVTGSGWVVNTVITPGAYFNGVGPVASVRVTFYDNAGGLPGAVIAGCDYPAIVPAGAATGTFTTTLVPACTLTAGVKWVSVQANMDFAAGGQWGWTTRSVQSGNLAVWRNPGGGFPGGCTTYTARTTCEASTADSPDQLFRLDGDLASCTVNADCVDANLCNGAETCVANACTPGTPISCDDGLFCTLDSCIPGTGACTYAANLCQDNDYCTLDSCDEAADTCVHTSLPPFRLCNTGAITIPDVGTATPYPSVITVAGLDPSALLCSVELNGIIHTFANDIDMLLVAPGTASNAIIMSDAGGTTAIAGVNLTLRDNAALSIPSPAVSGTFKPTNVGAGDPFAGAPAPTGGSALSVFSNTDPNGDWKLFVVDDAGGDLGSVANGWCLNLVEAGCALDVHCDDGNVCNGLETCVAGTCTSGTPVNCDDGFFCTLDSCDPPTGTCSNPINTCNDGSSCTVDSCDESGNVCVNADVSIQFCNTASISIPLGGAATPYPSPIVIAGQPPAASVCSVSLNGISHAFPDDIDILLARTAGTNALIMSDVGGAAAVTNVSLRLDDGAASSLPDGATLVSGSFKPTNIGGADSAFPPSAPAISGPSALSTFNGGNPNGVWNLWVRDEFTPDAGTISGGWCLNIVPTPCNNDGECADGNVCNGVETCVAGTCTVGTPVDCSDGLFCTLDTCDPPTGTCGHPPNPCGDGNACTVDSCDEATDTCGHLNQCVQVCNSAAITINDSATPPTAASPYPSTISLSGVSGLFSLASVELRNLTHTFPNDLDVLLVAPNTPDTATIMSDVGGGAPGPAGVTLILADGAPPIPAGGPLVSGTFAPTNVSPGTGTEAFAAPAPIPSGGTALNQFDGTDPNGDWVLYVVDDQDGDSGTLAGGWCLNYLALCTSAAECDDADPCTTDACTNSVCTHSALGTPGLASGVAADPDKQTYTWNAAPNATRYDVVRGSLSAFPVGPGGADEVCFADEPGASVVDGVTPTPGGTGFWYLVRGDNDCTAGGYGTESNGSPRNTTTCP